jgi:DNA-binding HxlR family transcriptional regulator
MADRWEAAGRIVSLVTGRWTMTMLGELSARGRRYQELLDVLDGISHKVLTETLRRAERDGLVARQLDPNRVETATLYQLTDLGRSLGNSLESLSLWAEANWSEVEAARLGWGRRSL